MTEPRSAVFRPDIEGLRAIAIGLVLLYHAGLPFLPGGFVGVDVFFVISGFLITSLLVREAERTGRVSLRRFYARRAKRLLPASAVVLVVCSVLTVWLINASDRRAFGLDISSAAAYVVNWRLAARSVDYLAEGTGPSPVLHFWSLAVEEQFYFVWPFLVIVALLVANRLRWSMRRSMMVALAAVGVPSFAASVIHTANDQTTAFFVTTTRMWELAVGAAVAIAAPRFARLPERAASAVSIGGVAVIVASALLLRETVAWPGWLAALPVVGAAAIIAGGVAHPRTVAARALGLKPMVWLGGLSYSLYLWHWPTLVFAEARFGTLRVREALLVVALSIIPAYLSLRFIENPARYSKRLARGSALALAMGAALTLLGVAAGLAVALSGPAAKGGTETIIIELPEGSASAGVGSLGAQALGDDPTNSPAGVPQDVYEKIIPDPALAPEDLPKAYALDCATDPESIEVKTCSVGDLEGSTVIAAVGDSKMLQYFDALDIVGRAIGVRFDVITKSGCKSTDATTSIDGGEFTSCNEYNELVDALLAQSRPDAIITAGNPVHVTDDSPLDAVQGYAERWSRWSQLGMPTIVLLEYPPPPGDVYECLQQNPDTATVCAYDRAESVARSGADVELEAASQVPGTTAIDLSDFVCPQAMCAPVIGDVLVLRQGSHLTNTYAVTLAPQLIREIKPVVEEIKVGS